jgi:hypothetical protein
MAIGRPHIDLTGKRFTRLVVLRLHHVNSKSVHFYECRCDCGAIRIVRSHHMTTGETKSCGCYSRESKLVHGASSRITGRTAEYRAWRAMKERCYAPSHIGYHRYGGRGITVCARWLNSFPNFLADLGRKPTPKHSLEQGRNTSRNRLVTANGKTQPVSAWAIETGILDRTIIDRLNRGWSDADAVLTPRLTSWNRHTKHSQTMSGSPES